MLQMQAFFTPSEHIESVLPQAASLLGILFFFLSQHTVKDAPP